MKPQLAGVFVFMRLLAFFASFCKALHSGNIQAIISALLVSDFQSSPETKIKMTSVKELAEQIRQSDQRAFNKLFDLLWEPMFGYAASLIQDETAAQDLQQEVWIDYWKRRENIQTDNIKAYLYKAMRYKCYNYLRNNKIPDAHLELAETIGVEPAISANADVLDLNFRIDKILASLPQRCQEIFLLSRINELSNKEISQTLNISQRTVENQISLALRRLKKDLEIIRMFLCL